MSNGTTNTQFAEALKHFSTALAIVINEFNFADLIKCLSQKGEKLTQFLRLVLQALIEGKDIVVIDYSKKIINIDRSKKFDPAKFIDQGWQIDEQDERVLQISEIDLNEIEFSNALAEDETSVNGEKRLKRLKKDGRVRLDVAIFLHLWNNKHLIPESWKEKVNGNIKFIIFDGTILEVAGGHRGVLCLCWGDGGWRWPCRWLGSDFRGLNVSALLASKNKK